MKVTLLVALLALHIWICTCATPRNDDSKSSDKELVWNEMRSSLQNIQASDRPMFMIRCGGGYTCTTKDIPNIKWQPGTGEIAKNRFWKTYACFKAEDITTCPVDGHWGAWSPWSKCTANCGLEGNSTRTRLCNNPHPVNGGLECSGYSTGSSICRGKCVLDRKQTAALVESKSFLAKMHQSYPRLRPLCLLSHCLYSQAARVVKTGDLDKYWSSLQCVKYKRACPDWNRISTSNAMTDSLESFDFFTFTSLSPTSNQSSKVYYFDCSMQDPTWNPVELHHSMDGNWASWTHWSNCEPKCGSGTRWRVRNCTFPPPENNGLICRGALYQEEPCVGMTCEKKDFSVEIYVSDWTVFGPCSVSCGQYGVKKKRLVCLSPGKCGDLLKRKNNELVIHKPCFLGPCPADGKWSSWSQYTECSAECGEGRKLRIRTCDGINSSDGAVCTGQSVNVTSCKNKCKDPTLTNETGTVTAPPFVPVQQKVWRPDPKNPYQYELEPGRFSQFTYWSAWSQCSKSCETGRKSRSRKCTVAGRCLGEVRQVLFCNTDKCQVNGGWSEWMAWSYCSVTCGDGQRWRYRKCDKPLPQFGGTCFGKNKEEMNCNLGNCTALDMEYGHWAAWTSCSKRCGVGQRMRPRYCVLDIKYLKDINYRSLVIERIEICRHRAVNMAWGSCGQMPCQVDGDWAHWSSWSSCSHSCGGGIHYRDRTCTDPAPLYGGSRCNGPGSEVTPCFQGPCPDREETGVRLNGSSGLLYSPFHKPQSYLSIHLLLHPLRPDGTIMYRSHECKVEKCRHSVNVTLVDSKPHIVAVNRGSRIIIKSNTTLQVREWHTVYVYLSQFDGFLRVNNGVHLRENYYPEPSAQVNYDSEMTLGAKAEDGFVGVIAEANVNFQALSLRRISGWKGYGMPEDEWLTQTVHVDPVTKHPKFKSDNFIKLSISDFKTLTIKMSIWPQDLEGLVVFNKGRIPGSFVYLIIHKGVFRFCFNCGQQSVCMDVQDVEAMRWYHVSIIVSGSMSSIRINLGKAVQISSPLLPYYAGSHVFVGGGESQDRAIFTAITGIDRGFSGAFHEVIINGQHYALETQPLVDSRGFMNTEGVIYPEKVMEVFERNGSKVVLRCDYSRYAYSGSDTYVEWFHVDKKIKTSPDRKITPRLPGDSYLGALTLSAKHHGSGLYLCMVRHNGRLTNHIAFVLTRDNTEMEYELARREVTGVHGFIIFMGVFVMFSLAFATCKVFQQAKEDGIRPIIVQLEQLKARLSNKVKTEVTQPPGIDDLNKAEVIHEETINETGSISDEDTKETQDQVSEISETPETGNIEIDLQSSYSCDDLKEDQQPIAPYHQSTHGTSAAVLHQPSTITNAARRSSVTLYGSQSARSNINDDEVQRRSSVNIRGTHSTRDDIINDDEIPRRSSVMIRGTHSTRDDIIDDEVPRRSSVMIHGTHSTRDDIIDDEIPRRSLVMIRGTHSTRNDIIDDEVPRRSSVHVHSTQSARDDIKDDKMPRRSSVNFRGTQDAVEDIDDEILSSVIVTIEGEQYVRPDQKLETEQWSPYPSNVSVRGDVAKDVSSRINSLGDVSRSLSYRRASQMDDVRGVSSHSVPTVRSSVSSRGRLGSSHKAHVTENNDAYQPEPQISWTHRSTHQIAKESVRSMDSHSPSRQWSSDLENQMSCSLPPAGSPSPPKTSLVRTSPSHQQPDLAVTVSANSSLTGTDDPQYTLPTLQSTQILPQPPSQANIRQPPSQGNIQQPPSQTNIRQPPSQANIRQPPSQSNIRQPPSQANIRQPPRQANIRQPPSQSNMEGGDVVTSSSEESSSDKTSSSSDQSSDTGTDSDASLSFPPLPTTPPPTT